MLSSAGSTLLARLTVRERPNKVCFRFWQEGSGYNRNLYSRRAIAASIDYIHTNPVTRGLCGKAIDWKWPSARFHSDDGNRPLDPDLPLLHPLPREALM